MMHLVCYLRLTWFLHHEQRKSPGTAFETHLNLEA